MSLTPGWGSSDATSLTDKKPKKRNRSNVTNSVKTLKMVHIKNKKKFRQVTLSYLSLDYLFIVRMLNTRLRRTSDTHWQLTRGQRNKKFLVYSLILFVALLLRPPIPGWAKEQSGPRGLYRFGAPICEQQERQ